MLTGVTSSGFNYEIADDRLNNMELIDAIAEYDDLAGAEGEEANVELALILSKLCRLLLGHQQKKKLYDHLREPGGNVPPLKVAAEVMDIIKNEKAKN